MVSYSEAGRMLDICMEALPAGIFDELNGGVNLIMEPKSDGKGGYILGLYHNNIMGRYIEIFYGSFAELYGDIPPMQFERRLRSTLHHELTHHIESLAGDRSLEHWDEEQDYIWANLEASRETESIIFCDDDDTALAPAAKAVFDSFNTGVRSLSAGIFEAGSGMNADCAAALMELGFAAENAPQLLTEELFEAHDTVICMTLAQVDELLERFPGSEEKLMCAAETDILRPRLRVNWKKTLRRLYEAVEELSVGLKSEYELIALDDGIDDETLAALEELERENFSLPMDAAMLRRLISDPNGLFIAAAEGETLLGYIGGKLIFDELEIYNVAVFESCRRRGIGYALVEAMSEAAGEKGAERLTLELRESNSGALALYKKAGFTEVGRRKGYYEKPREDAVLMDKTL